MPADFRPLEPVADVDAVAALHDEATAFWLMIELRQPDRARAAAFFTDGPPGHDPARSHRLGLFDGALLSGVAELSFGFPEPDDAYLGLMLLAPRLRGQGHGARFLTHVEVLARQAGAARLYLAVLEQNSGGRAFWQREGFRPTGLSRQDPDTGNALHRLMKPL